VAILVFWPAIAGLQALAEAPSARPKRPNVVFLLADDLRADAIGALGRGIVKTPNLDQIVQSGFVFNRAYCLGANSGAVCLPSRNMILSGNAYFRWNGRHASGDAPNFPLSLEAAGYQTYHHGKHGNVAIEIEKRFQQVHYLKDDQERRTGQPGKTIVDAAAQFLQSGRDGRPFFLYLAFEAPHDPRVADKAYLDLYDPTKIPLPDNYLPIHPFDNGEMTVRDEGLAPWPRSESEIRRHLHEYYAVISGLDFHIGRLIQRLKDLGEYDNTIFIISSDHGLAIGSHGLMGKQSLYEHSMRSPLVFAGPGIPKGRSDALVYLLDIYPTICELTGAKVPERIDGRSLALIIHGQAKSVRDSLFLSYQDVQRAVTDGRWKLIRYPKINRSQLFDLKNDPDERHDLTGSGSGQQTERIEQLMTLMTQWQHQLGDPAPLSTATPANPVFTPPVSTADPHP
jgi:arylsulfatase A-like enzyme